jgi:anti-sigma factor RsiW
VGCESWKAKLDAYIDGELAPTEANAFGSHTRSCSACAVDALERVQIKRSISAAGKRYTSNPAFRARIARSVAAKPQHWKGSAWKIVAVPAFLIIVLSIAVNWYAGRENARRQRVYSELADLHVAALASSSPVDVVSTDRHTVKPWFQGKIPFTFNLPELQGSEFTLLGGRVTYLAQTPGAHLIYQIRKHEISVFIFQDRGGETASLPSGVMPAASFNVDSWTHDGLRYFIVGDINADDIQALSKLMRGAG